MDAKDILNIVMDKSLRGTNTISATTILFDSEQNHVVIMDVKQLGLLAAKLDPEQPCLLWVHAGRRGNPDGVANQGKEVGQDIFKIYGLTKFNFLSMGAEREDEEPIVISKSISKVPISYDSVATLSRHLPYIKDMVVQAGELLPKPTLSNARFKYYDKNDWRNADLEFVISRDELQTALELLFGNRCEFEITVVEPGLSGAFVLKVGIKESNGTPYTELVKFDGKKRSVDQERAAAIQLEKLRFPSNFIKSNRGEFTNSKVLSWYCVHFPFREGKSTLKQFLCSEIGVRTDSELEKIAHKLFDTYESKSDEKDNNWVISFKKSHPWGGDEVIDDKLPYAGLKLQQSSIIKKAIIKTLSYFDKIYLDTSVFDGVSKIKVDNTTCAIKTLFHFLDNGQYNLSNIDGIEALVPVSYVHGDFNSGNILVDHQDGATFEFIDFAFFPEIPNQHALTDYGKLSVDIERRVLADQFIFNNEIRIEDWCKVHNDWMNAKPIRWENHNSHLRKVYLLNDVVRTRALARFNNLSPTGFSEDDCLRQFYMVRLTYLFRTIAHSYFSIQKQLFAIRASYDIIKYLFNDIE